MYIFCLLTALAIILDYPLGNQYNKCFFNLHVFVSTQVTHRFRSNNKKIESF